MIPAAQADTPLKQLYYAIQMMIIDAASQHDAKTFYLELVRKLMVDYPSLEFRRLVSQLNDEIDAGREFNALKVIRDKFEIERERWNPEALPLALEL